MKQASVPDRLASVLATHLTLDDTRPDQPAASPGRDAQTSPRLPRDAELPPRPGSNPHPSLQDLNADTLSHLIGIGTQTGTMPGLRAVARLARVSKQLRATVSEAKLLPPIRLLLAQTRLTLSPAAQTAFEHQLPECVARLAPAAQIVLFTKLIDEFDRVPAGPARSLRFAALRRTATALPPASAAAALARLAACVRLLPQSRHHNDRSAEFAVLLDQCRLLTVSRTDALCALARVLPLLANSTGARASATGALHACARTMAPPGAARLLHALIGPIASLARFDVRDRLVDATFATLDDGMPAHQESAVLQEMARHLTLLTRPDDRRLLPYMAIWHHGYMLLERIGAHARALPDTQHAQNLNTLVPLCMLLPAMFQAGAMKMCRDQAATLPETQKASVQAQIDRLAGPPASDRPQSITLGQHTITAHADRNDTTTQLSDLPIAQRSERVYTLAREWNDSIPPAMREQKFSEVYRAAGMLPPTHKSAVLSILAERLDLLLPCLAGQAAQDMLELCPEWPLRDRMRVIAPVTKHIGHLPTDDQCRCADGLQRLAGMVGQDNQAVALMLQWDGLQCVERDDMRHALTGRMHRSIMELSLPNREALLPDWIGKLTPFNAGSDVNEMLLSVQRETIQSCRDPVARTAILQSLATHLGHFRDAERPVMADEIRTAAQAMPSALGAPILDTLALQHAYALQT